MSQRVSGALPFRDCEQGGQFPFGPSPVTANRASDGERVSGTAAPRRRIPIKFRGEPAFVWKEIRPHAGAVLVVEIRGHAFTVGQAPQTTGEARIRALWWLADNALRWRVPNLVRRIR